MKFPILHYLAIIFIFAFCIIVCHLMIESDKYNLQTTEVLTGEVLEAFYGHITEYKVICKIKGDQVLVRCEHSYPVKGQKITVRHLRNGEYVLHGILE